MKYPSIHIWFAFSISVAAMIAINPQLARTPLVCLIFFSSLLRKSREEVASEFGRKISMRELFFGLIMVALLVISAFTGFTKVLNEMTSDLSIRIVACIYGLACVSIYAFSISKRKLGSST